MKEIVTTITQRGQVTLPAEVRRLWGAKPRDKVAFQIDGDQVRLVPAGFTIESAYGSVKPLRRPEDFKRLSRAARDEHAAQVVRELGQR
ncbi:MAG TPA: AbrB/MazE/SpoVT family DNA-binding domain-containing protein [Chloroflexota bacterium]|jgi:AbrB family looped-hinge helix DNA binding protein